jgi:hypothetical protein
MNVIHMFALSPRPVHVMFQLSGYANIVVRDLLPLGHIVVVSRLLATHAPNAVIVLQWFHSWWSPPADRTDVPWVVVVVSDLTTFFFL